MSKRDGKMYVAQRLSTELDTSAGFPLRIAGDTYAGALLVFWTKTAAREHYGKNVELVEIQREPSNE